MPRKALVPSGLASGPFHVEKARRNGLTKHQLNGPTWTRIGPRVYALAEIADAPLVRLVAAFERLPSSAVFSGTTAGFLHGLDLPLTGQIEVTVPPSSRTSRMAGLALRRRVLHPAEIVLRNGLRTTSVLRTIADLGCRLPLVDAVVTLDEALHRRLVSLAQLDHWAGGHAGHRGAARLRRAIVLAEPAAESVMETRLRLLLVLAGLPRPKAQVPLHDSDGWFVGRPDLDYPSKRLAIEYDGATHRERLAADNRRQNRFMESGYLILRFTAADLLNTPAAVVGIVRRSLGLSA